MLYLVDDCPIYLADVVFSQADCPREVVHYSIVTESQYFDLNLIVTVSAIVTAWALRYINFNRVGRRTTLLIENQ